MRIRRSDAGEFAPDETAVLRDYSGERVGIELLRVEGTHEVAAGETDAYFVLEGDGHVHISSGDRILEIDEEDVVHVDGQAHTIEGNLDVLAMTARPDQDDS